MEEAIGTRAILAKLAVILAAHFRTVHKYGADLSMEKRSVQGIQSFLAKLTLGVDLIPILERVTLVGINPDGMLHLIHLLFSVRVNLYLNSLCLFACMGELLAEGLPLLVEIPLESFAAWRSACAMPQVDHVTHIGGISPPNWQTNPCNRAVKTAGKDYFYLAFQGLTSVPLNCAACMLQREVDGPLNIFDASKGLFSLLTIREPSFEDSLD